MVWKSGWEKFVKYFYLTEVRKWTFHGANVRFQSAKSASWVRLGVRKRRFLPFALDLGQQDSRCEQWLELGKLLRRQRLRG